MRQGFESKITLRLYDTTFIKKLDDTYALSGERFESKNHFLTEILKTGFHDMFKATSKPAVTCDKTFDIALTQIRQLIEDFYYCNKQQSKELLAHLQTSEKLSSAIYHMLLALTEDERISTAQLEAGFYDDLPERLANDLKDLLKCILNKL